MPRYYGIDLGTTNTVISTMSIFNKESILRPGKGLKIESVPIYYDQYEWDENENRYISYFESVDRRGDLGADDIKSKMQTAPWLMPSVIYRHRHGGVETILTGEPAQKAYDKNPNKQVGDFYENTKILMDEKPGEQDSDSLSPEDVAYYLLRTCFKSILLHNRSVMQKKTAAVGISYPAARNQMNYLECLRRAANRAAHDVGFLQEEAAVDFFCTTQEPYAAITNLIVDECKRINSPAVGQEEPVVVARGEEKTVSMMVVDVGGGTTDIAVQPIRMVKNPEAHLPQYPEHCEMGTPENLHEIRSAVTLRGDFGGADVDVMLARKIARILYKQFGEEPDLDRLSPHVVNQAMMLAREMKHYFSNDPGRQFFTKMPFYFFAPGDTTHMPTLKVQRSEYESWIHPYIYNVDGYYDVDGDYKHTDDGRIYSIQRLMNDTRIHANCRDWNDVNFVFVTGGMSKMPEIQQMIEQTVAGSSCRVIYSRKHRETEDGQASDADSMRFFDIAYGVAVYACMTNSAGTDRNRVPGESGLKYSDFVPSPHSSIALFADVGRSRLPVSLIKHGQALPVKDGLVEDIFTSRDVHGITVQLYTGIEPYDPHLTRHARCEVELNEHPPRPGEKLSLRYDINQDMYATLYLQYKDAQGVDRTVDMRNINLDAAENQNS